MIYKELIEDMCMDCNSYPCYALKNNDHCCFYNQLNKLIDKEQKDRWHDLKKNPNDLPIENGKYLVVNSDREFNVLYYCKNAKRFGYECCWTHDELPEYGLSECPKEYYFEPIDEEKYPIAWKGEAIEF